MRRIMISAMSSGSGKTVMACGLMRAFVKRGRRVEAFKCGPDYIDPMFHTRVLGIPSRNLDLFLQGREGIRRTLGRQSAGSLAVLEGAMGFYDGLAGTTAASAWETADISGTPVILVLRPKGQSVTLAAQVRGLMAFRQPSRIAGLLLTDCRPGLYARLKTILERETGLPVLGFLPPLPEAALESRHLGLVTAEEIRDLSARFDLIAEALEEHADLDALWDLAAGAEAPGAAERQEEMPETAAHGASGKHKKTLGEVPEPSAQGASGKHKKTPEKVPEPSVPGAVRSEKRLCCGSLPAGAAVRCRIAVASDEAFSFYYEDNLDALREAGAELLFFSPLRDAALPEADGLYLGGGYPELHAAALSENRSLRESIRRAVCGGMPCVAECGGFLYLQEALEDREGISHPMAGVLPGRGFRTGSLQRFGYLTLRAERDSLLFAAGEEIPAHEFHYWDSTECGEAIRAEKADGRSWRCGFLTGNLYAAFPHLHWGGAIPMAERFAAAAERYAAGNRTQ